MATQGGDQRAVRPLGIESLGQAPLQGVGQTFDAGNDRAGVAAFKHRRNVAQLVIETTTDGGGGAHRLGLGAGDHRAVTQTIAQQFQAQPRRPGFQPQV